MKDKADPARYFEWRKGIGDFPDWDGVKHDSDPGSLPANALALGLNVRFEPGGVRVRPGISEIVSFPNLFTEATSPAEQVNWLGLHHMQFKGPRLWVFGNGLINLERDCEGGWISWYTPDRNPTYQLAGIFPCAAVRIPGAGMFDGAMYYGDHAVLQRVNVVEGLRGRTLAVGSLNNYAEQVAGYSDTPGMSGTALQEFDGKLFISLQDTGGTASNVGYWDGTSFWPEELVTGTEYGTNFCVWRDSKLVMLQYNSDVVRIRDTAGSWASLNLPHVVTNEYKNSMVEFRDAIYIAAGRYIIKISNFNAPEANEVRDLGDSTFSTAVATLGDNLYYLWTAYSVGTGLGLYEPDAGAGTWVDTYADLGNTTLVCLVAYRNRLYATGYQTDVWTHARPMNPTSEWVVVYTFARPVQPMGMRVG